MCLSRGHALVFIANAFALPALQLAAADSFDNALDLDNVVFERTSCGVTTEGAVEDFEDYGIYGFWSLLQIHARFHNGSAAEVDQHASHRDAAASSTSSTAAQSQPGQLARDIYRVQSSVAKAV